MRIMSRLRLILNMSDGYGQSPCLFLGGIINALKGAIASISGEKFIVDEIKGDANKSAELGITLANKILGDGGKTILDEIRGGLNE